jgi:hypothetical protein
VGGRGVVGGLDRGSGAEACGLRCAKGKKRRGELGWAVMACGPRGWLGLVAHEGFI